MTMKTPNTGALDAILKQKEAWSSFTPQVPRLFEPITGSYGMDPSRLGAAKKSKKESLKEKQRKEFDLWKRWNDKGRKPEDLQPLYDSFKPVINSHARNWTGRVQLPNSTIYHEANKNFVDAVKKYDPNKAQLNTWVDFNLSRKLSRYVKKYQNLGKIPEGQISLIPEYKKAKEELASELGYEPDALSIADKLKKPVSHVRQLELEMSRDDLMGSGFLEDPVEVKHPATLEALTLVEYDLNPEQRSVFEYTFGLHGKPQLSPGEIAKNMKIQPSKVSRIRKSIKEKLDELEGTLT